MRSALDKLDDQLAHIEELDDRSELLILWAKVYGGRQPPRHISNGLLRRAMAYRIQERALGGLKPALKRQMQMIVTGGAKTEDFVRAGLMASEGIRLIREWHGKVYEVLVHKDRVEMNGQIYKSLSEAARFITGVRWSGPRFFGLSSVASSASSQKGLD